MSYRLLYLLLLTSIIACTGDGPADPSRDSTEGSASFSYVGPGLAGDFSAVGKFERDGNGSMILQSFATGVDISLPQYQLDYYGIVAAHFYPPELDDLSVILSGKAIGDYPITIAAICGILIDQGGAEPCSSVAFDFRVGVDGGYPASATSFEMISGEVTVHSISDGRLEGTFSGIARQLSADPYSAERYLPEIEIEVIGGTFNVPIISLDYWNGQPIPPPLSLAPLGPTVRD